MLRISVTSKLSAMTGPWQPAGEDKVAVSDSVAPIIGSVIDNRIGIRGKLLEKIPVLFTAPAAKIFKTSPTYFSGYSKTSPLP